MTPLMIALVIAAAVGALVYVVASTSIEKADVRDSLRRLEGYQIQDVRDQEMLAPMSERVFASIVDAETPPGIAAEVAMPSVQKQGDVVFLEGVQDPGNVGAIMRSAAALGVACVVLDRACADAWSAKTLRAGMGAHFALQVKTVASLEDELERFAGRILCAIPRAGVSLEKANLEGPIGWLFGAEGQGVSAAAAKHADLKVTIAMAPGSESLNVAAAAAICLYEAFSRRGARS